MHRRTKRSFDRLLKIVVSHNDLASKPADSAHQKTKMKQVELGATESSPWASVIVRLTASNSARAGFAE